jgi:transposase
LAMEVVHPRVAGIDVHKKVIWVAVRLPGQGPGQRAVTVRRFKTFWRSLQQMAAWLAELGVTDAAMESTGVYWWPVYHALADAGIEVCVCNAAHMRNVPGRKTDLLTELRNVSAAQAGCTPRQPTTGMSERSESPGRRGPVVSPIATETGHTRLNRSPAFSLLPIFGVNCSTS